MAELQPLYNEQERLRQAIPQELQAVDSWVNYELKTVGERTTKLPINVHTGGLASTVNPETWASFPEAVQRSTRIGFVFPEGANFTGIDFDHCITDGHIDPAVKEQIRAFNSYTEISLSEHGIHVIVYGHIPTGRRTSTTEMYSEGRYFALTGKRLLGTPQGVRNAQSELDDLYASLAPNVPSSPVKMAQNEVYAIRSDEEVLRRAMAAKNGSTFSELWRGKHDSFSSKSHADFQLLLKLGYWTNFDASQMERLFLQSGLADDKTLSKRGNTTYLQYTINKILKQHGK